MSEYYIDINVVAENLAELLTNSTNMASVFYDIFLNPIPMDVVLKQYNDENELVEVTIPNRAKDRRIALTGTGSPEGIVSAVPGVCYINEAGDGEGSGPIVYFKVEGTGATGWTEVLTESALDGLVARLRPTIGITDSTKITLFSSGEPYSSIDAGDIAANKSLSNLNSAGNAVLAGKASVDLNNLSSDGKARIAIKEYLTSETYQTNDIVMSIINSKMCLFRSVADNNTGNDLDDTTYWEEVPLGGSSRCIGEIVTSTTPLDTAGIYPANGDTISGDGMYADFVSYMKDKYNGSTLYAYEYTIGSTVHRVYIKDKKIVDGYNAGLYPEGSFNTNLYNADGTLYEGSDFIVYYQSGFVGGTYGVYYVASGLRPPQGQCTYNYDNNIYLSVYSNIKKRGNLLDSNGILSGFSTTNYGVVPCPLEFGSNPWTFMFKATTGADVTTNQFLNSNIGVSYAWGPMEVIVVNSHFKLVLSSNGQSTGDLGTQEGTYTVLPNTTYYICVTFTGSEYTLSYSLTGNSFNTDITVTSSTPVHSLDNMILGVDYTGTATNYKDPWLGTIDLNGCYVKIDGKDAWKGRMPEGFVTEYEHYMDIETYDTCTGYAYNEERNELMIPKLPDFDDYLIQNIVDGSNVCRVYADGWCEQSGFTAISGGYATVVLNRPYLDLDYTRFAVCDYGSYAVPADVGFKAADIVAIDSVTNDSFRLLGSTNADTAAGCTAKWKTEGYTNVADLKTYKYIIISTSTKINIESDIDRIASDMARKVDKSALSRIYPVIEEYWYNNAWYRIYADGWCEQGAAEPKGTSYAGTERIRTLLKPYRDTSYSVFLSPYGSVNSYSSGYYQVKEKTTSNFTTWFDVNCDWFACGYIW